MNIKSFIQKIEFDNLDKRLKEIKEKLEQYSFNLFSISSYTAHLENFHSDVIAILLNSEERHKQENYYLDCFLDYIIEHMPSIKKEDYMQPEVTREKGRIDVCIKDNRSKRAIIIENKINNAKDQNKQLENYYDYLVNLDFEVDAIVYLTLNGNKNAPLTDNLEINEKFLNISAFTNSGSDLCNGWLKKAYGGLSDEDNSSFVFQYIKLLKHLSQVGMYKDIEDEFYEVISEENSFQKAKAINELLGGLGQYRADLFALRIKENYEPFTKIYRYRTYHWLFENYNDNGIVFKLDVQFHSDGNASIDFWNPGGSEEIQNINTFNKLQSIDLIEKFEQGGMGGGMFKSFTLEEYGSIKCVDDELYKFVAKLFIKLRS